MKTLTEFPSPTIKNALKTQQELLAAGKTPEELPAAMGEALKLEGDKLTFLLSALEEVKTRTDSLKRVIVSQLNEGETVPSTSKLIGEKVYTVEFYPAANKAPQKRADEGRGPRDGKRGGKRGEKRGGGRGGDDRKPRGEPRGERKPRPEGAPMQTQAAAGDPSAPKRPRRGPPTGAPDLPKPLTTPVPRKEAPAPAAAPQDAAPSSDAVAHS